MKPLLITICLLIGFSGITEAKIPEGNRPYGMVRHHRHGKLSNKIKFFKRQHQRRVFTNFLRWDKRYKGKWGESFAPKGQGLW